MARCYVGLSGYSYKAWQGPGRFYPAGLKPAAFLSYYASRYSTVELDGLWYRLPTGKAVQAWLDQTPGGFLFTPKAHRQITHIRRLKPEGWPTLTAMIDRLEPLRQAQKLGPVLLQLPPTLHRDDDRLAAFLRSLPAGQRWAMEFRHESWHEAPVEGLLRDHGVAWAAVETDEHPALDRNTADFRYVRLRKGAYEPEELQRWAARFQEMIQGGQNCFVFCKHEDEGSPWQWADEILRRLGPAETGSTAQAA
jgi:uncharacterized protein YecE (DUF72 family)